MDIGELAKKLEIAEEAIKAVEDSLNVATKRLTEFSNSLRELMSKIRGVEFEKASEAVKPTISAALTKEERRPVRPSRLSQVVPLIGSEEWEQARKEQEKQDIARAKRFGTTLGLSFETVNLIIGRLDRFTEELTQPDLIGNIKKSIRRFEPITEGLNNIIQRLKTGPILSEVELLAKNLVELSKTLDTSVKGFVNKLHGVVDKLRIILEDVAQIATVVKRSFGTVEGGGDFPAIVKGARIAIEEYNDFIAALKEIMLASPKEWIMTALNYWQEALANFFGWLTEVFMMAINFLIERLTSFFGWLTEVFMMAINFLIEKLTSFFGWLTEVLIMAIKFLIEKFISFFSWLTEQVSGVMKLLGDLVPGSLKNLFKSLFDGQESQTSGGLAGRLEAMGRTGVITQGIQLATAGPRWSGIVNGPHNEISVDVRALPGMDEQKLASEVTRQIEEALERQNKVTMEALAPQLEGI